MKLVKINDKLTIGDQPSVMDFEEISRKGYGAVLNARPDGEAPDQPGNALERAAAAKVGMGYAFVPVTVATIGEADVRAFQQALDSVDRPVVAHCKSGIRALTLFAIGEVIDGRMKSDELDAFGKAHGFDLSMAKRWLERRKATEPNVKAFFDARTGSVQYVASDLATKRCAIIDPVYDFDEKSGTTGTMSADAILAFVESEGLSVEWILDTHPHADHFSAAQYLKSKTGAPTAIGAHVVEVQNLWKGIYNLADFVPDGSQWDHLFEEGETFNIGSINARVMFSPGHTLASITYVIGDAAFVHDTMFMPDSGTARADFPGGDALKLWTSIQAILALPDETRIFTGHDYQPDGRNPKWESTVGEQKRSNVHVNGMDETKFVALREARDKTLPMPKLILHALQVNIQGGRLPSPESNGTRYLKIPLDALKGAAW
jgi:uncharacterized protein (TIGR01244 family)